MQLRTMAEIAAVVGTIIVVLNYFKVEPNILDKIPEFYKKEITRELVATDLKINVEDYEKKEDHLYNMYRAALLISYASQKDDALEDVVREALNKRDFKIAILAAKSITYPSDKDKSLELISDEALKNKKDSKYAVISAELIQYPSKKDEVLKKIIDALSEKNSSELSELDKYKKIYKFADHGANMGMLSGEAKEFTEKWIKTDLIVNLYILRIYILLQIIVHKWVCQVRMQRNLLFIGLMKNSQKKNLKILKKFSHMQTQVQTWVCQVRMQRNLP